MRLNLAINDKTSEEAFCAVSRQSLLLGSSGGKDGGIFSGSSRSGDRLGFASKGRMSADFFCGRLHKSVAVSRGFTYC